MAIFDRITSAWNAFRSDKQVSSYDYSIGPSTSERSHTPRLRYSAEKSIISSIYSRIANDVAGVDIRHVKLDDQGRYSGDIKSELNRCFTLEANIDQAPQAFRRDVMLTLFDKGVAAIVPIDILKDPQTGRPEEIFTLRVGEIKKWYPRHVCVSVYNDAKGIREEIVLEKRYVGIIENPFFTVMNESNSTLQRLIRKLHLLDAVDEASSSGKLDMIIQLPYVIKSEARRQAAEQRRQDIEFQLKGSQYGIAYTDGTEKITQLNRPAENNLLKQIEFLQTKVYEELGITAGVMDGSADEKTMLNYYNRTVEPLVVASVEAEQRAFLGVKGTANDERIMYFINPFKFTPISEFAEIADKFSRNEIFSPNELRGFMRVPPSTDPKADKLINSNMPQPQEDQQN